MGERNYWRGLIAAVARVDVASTAANALVAHPAHCYRVARTLRLDRAMSSQSGVRVAVQLKNSTSRRVLEGKWRKRVRLLGEGT